MRLTASSETELIEKTFAGQCRYVHPYTRVPNGDDASIHNLPEGMELAVSTDCFVAGVHWPDDFSLVEAGERSLGAALSDMAAMGAETAWTWLTVHAASAADAEALGRGLTAAIQRYRLELAGGDTARSPTNAVSIVVAGLVPAGNAMCRDAAKAGDDLWLLGHLGHASLGLDLWKQGIHGGRFVSRFRKVSPLLSEGLQLRKVGIRCCIDISDGLLRDADHIAKKSGLAIHIWMDAIPDYHTLLESVNADRAQHYVLSGGEDYALLFTAPEGFRAKLRKLAACRIGICKEGHGVRVSLNDQPVQVREMGWDHFA